MEARKKKSESSKDQSENRYFTSETRPYRCEIENLVDGGAPDKGKQTMSCSLIWMLKIYDGETGRNASKNLWNRWLSYMWKISSE